MTATNEQRSRTAGLWRELTRMAFLSLYLYICIGTIILHKMAVLRAHDIDYVPYGFAAIEALIIAKFILVGQTLHIGERYRGRPLVYFLAYQVAMFVLLVVALSFLEEIIAAAIHGRPISAAINNFTGGDWLQLLTQCLLLCLILIPYLGLGAISDALGPGRLRQMFFGDRR